MNTVMAKEGLKISIKKQLIIDRGRENKLWFTREKEVGF